MKLIQNESQMSMNKTLQDTDFKSVLVLGGIQSGKSTVANMFLGNVLLFKNMRIEQKVVQEPIIGHDKKQTNIVAYDQEVEICGEKVTLFDCAGLGGDLSIVQLAEILDASDQIKFVFVSTYQALKDNSLKAVLEQFVSILDDLSIMEKKISLVFTKTEKNLKNTLKELTTFKKKQSKEVAQLVSYMEKSVHLIPNGDFRKPKLFEEIFKSIDYLNTAEE